MKRISTSGQSILEYTLLLGVVITAIVLVLLGPGLSTPGNPGKSIKGAIQTSYQKTDQALNNTTANLRGGIFGP